jgi:hypothetical protein
MGGIHSARDVQKFHTTLIVQCGEPELANSWFGYHTHRQIRSVRFVCEANGKNIYLLINLLLFINIFNWQHFFSGYSSWTWDKSNDAFCRDTHAECRPSKRGATVRQLPRLTLCGMFVQPFSFVSYYFLKLNLMILVFIFRRHITIGWGRDMQMILRPTWISILIYEWRQDRLLDPIEIECIDSLTLQLKTCRQLIVFQPLGVRNQYREPSLRSSQSCYSKECKNLWPI